MKTNNLTLIFTFLGALLLLIIIAPVVGMILKTPLQNIIETGLDKEIQQSIILTLTVSFCATIAFAIMAIPLSYLLARNEFKGKKIILAIIDIPVVIPHSAAGIALLSVVNRDTIPGKIADFFGFTFIGHPAGIALAMGFVSIPFLVNASVTGFTNVPEKLEKAALSLGASRIKTFFSISFPLAWRSILSGLIMMFSRGMSEFGAVIIIAYHPMITPVLIFERFNMFGLKYARPAAVIFILICIFIFVFLRSVGPKPKIFKKYD